ncbi:MAG: SRPBCC family protein [Bacteroidetes bacterium]|nr:SRPBCC family protein [Bacteroidota bacterium]
MKKTFKIALLILVAGLLAAYFLAPFGKSGIDDKKSVEYSMQINVSRDSAWKYLSNSNSAREWSVFVHHISTLNATEVPDGKPGSKRRCFCREDETGRRWDEQILSVQQDSFRTISIENMVKFPMTANHLETQQIYKSISENKCEITLRLYYIGNNFSFWDGLKTRAAAYTIQSIFRRNLENMKEILEGRKRKYEWKE